MCKKIPLTCLDICRMLSISSTGNVILCLNGGLSCLFSPSCMWRGVTDTSKDFVKYRVASFLHDITHHAVSC